MSQSVIGSLRVNLGLDSAQFEQGARRAMSTSDGMQNRFASLARGVAAATAGIAAAAGGITALATSSANAAREVQTFSRLSNANSQVFQKWAFGARSVGIEQDKLSDILKDVNDRVGDFIQTGGGPMADFFEKVAPKVGVTAEQFQKLSGPDALQLYVSSLEKAGASQQEMTFYLEAMASDATALLPLLSNNGEEMARLGTRAEELGAVMSEEAIAALNEARIALGESAAAWTGLGQTIGAAAAPALEAAARASANLAVALQPVVQVLGEASQYFGQVATVAGTAAVIFGARLAISVGTTYVSAAVAAVRQSVALEMALGATSRGAALASVGIKGLTTALRALKGVAISTVIGAMVVGLGEAIYWFGRLVSAVGGFGKALGMLGDVAAGVWQGIVASAAAIPSRLDGVWLSMKSSFLIRLSEMATAFHDFIWRVGNALQQTEGFEGVGDSLLGVATAASEASGKLYTAGAAAGDAAEGAFSDAAGTISEAFGPARAAVAALSDAVSTTTDETAAGAAAAGDYVAQVSGIGGSGGDGSGGAAGKAAKAVEKLRDQVKQLELDADPVKKYNAELAELDTLLNHGLSQGAYDKAVGKLNDELASSLPLVDDLTGAFSDFLFSGLKDFESFAQSIWSSFKRLLTDMIATAARNKIMLSLGLGGSGGLLGTAANAAGIGGAGVGGGGSLGLLGSVGSILGSVGQGFSLAVGSFMSGGISGLVGTIGAQVGAAATGSLTAIAGAVGAIAAPLAAVVGLVSFFSKKTKELDRGIRVTIKDMDALVETFSKTETSRFWGMKKNKSTDYDAASAEIADPITAAVLDVGESVRSVAESLNLATDALDSFDYQFKLSTKGLSEEDIAKLIEEQMLNLANAAAGAIIGTWSEQVVVLTDWGRKVEALGKKKTPFDLLMPRTTTETIEHVNEEFAKLQLEGEGAFETLQRLSQHLYTVNGVFDTLGQAVFHIGLQGADTASKLVQVFGDLETFTEATSAYFAAFYGQAEQLAILTRQTTEALSDLGYAMPETREQFRSMVEGLDLTTEKGRETYAALISMSGALDKILPAVNDFAAMLSGLVGSTSSAISGMISEASSMASSAAQAAGDWLRAADTLRDFLRDLTSASSSALSPAQQLAALTKELSATFSAARGGDIDAARDFSGVANGYLDAARAQASSALEYRRIEANVRAQANLLAGVSELEGAAQSAIEHLAQQQVDVLNELNDYLQSTDNLAPEDLAGFENRIGSLQAAIEQAEMFSYDYLKERLQVTVDLLPEANIPSDVKALIAAAANGIESSIEFAVRAPDLTPDLRWLAVTQASEHLKTVDFALGDDLDIRSKRLALDTIQAMTRTINLVMGSQLDHDEIAVALAGNSELARVVNVALASGEDQDAIKLALANTGSYSVAVRASLSASKEIRKIVFDGAGGYSAMIEAAFSAELTADQRRVLLQRQGNYAVTISATLASRMPDNRRRLLLNASTSAARAVTVAMAFAGSVTTAQRKLLLTQSANIQRKISAMVNPEGITAFDQLFLDQLANGGDRSLGITGWLETRGIHGLGKTFIGQLASGDGETWRTVKGGVEFGSLSGFASNYLKQIAAGRGAVARNVRAEVLTGAIRGLGADYLGQLLAGAGGVARTIVAKMNGSGIGQAGWNFVNLLSSGSSAINRVLNGHVNLSGLTAAQRSMLEAIQGGSVGTLRLGGSFVFDPSSAFSSWYVNATRDQMASPMAAVRNSLDSLRMAINQHRAELVAQAEAAERAARITSLQNSLSTAVQSNSALPSQGRAIIDQIEALERQTGVSLRKGSGDAILRVGSNGRIEYDASHYSYRKGDDLAGFRSTFYGADGLQAQIGKYNASVKSSSSTLNSLRKQIRDLGGVPAFAAGGLHAGGLRLVGENGPELEVTGPARYYSAPQTRGMLSRSEELAELRLLRKELADLRDTTTQLGLRSGRDLSKMRKLAEKADIIGTPPERSEA
ncbi:hypothetical protein [Salipiger bermudensis]|uniref:hypothetical protein n=1 Tax=Salipiger bermudensis TaxID=344736 RepID=UPI001CD60CBE|nr:hypothetical protein [Salipiger bermudensis]MCA0963219.1 hypothetical protein [Salipiger bermudensis]